MTKNLKSLLARKALPDMSRLADVSEFLTKSGYGSVRAKLPLAALLQGPGPSPSPGPLPPCVGVAKGSAQLGPLLPSSQPLLPARLCTALTPSNLSLPWALLLCASCPSPSTPAAGAAAWWPAGE